MMLIDFLKNHHKSFLTISQLRYYFKEQFILQNISNQYSIHKISFLLLYLQENALITKIKNNYYILALKKQEILKHLNNSISSNKIMLRYKSRNVNKKYCKKWILEAEQGLKIDNRYPYYQHIRFLDLDNKYSEGFYQFKKIYKECD